MASLPRIFVIGASGHGLVVCEAARAQGYEIAGWLDSFRPAGETQLDMPILGKPSELPDMIGRHGARAGILAISDNVIRFRVAEEIHRVAPAFEFVSVVHPRAWVSPSATVGHGSLILAGAVVNALCRIGEHCIINTKASLDHESVMERFSSLLPGVTTGGGVRVGEFSCLCAGATVSHRVTIGPHTIVGAGSTVLEDLPGYVLAAGTPAKPRRGRRSGERHF